MLPLDFAHLAEASTKGPPDRGGHRAPRAESARSTPASTKGPPDRGGHLRVVDVVVGVGAASTKGPPDRGGHNPGLLTEDGGFKPQRRVLPTGEDTATLPRSRSDGL